MNAIAEYPRMDDADPAPCACDTSVACVIDVAPHDTHMNEYIYLVGDDVVRGAA